MAIIKHRGYAGGRGDDPHYQGTKVNAFSAKTRNSEPTKENMAGGSKASYDVKNNATSPAGETMGQVKGKYKEALVLAKRLGDGMERQDAYRSGQYRQAVT